MIEDAPEEYVHLLSGHNFWGDHPLGRSIMGTRENVLNFDSQKIKDFFHRFYHPERIVVAVCGNVDHQSIVDLVGPAFGSIVIGQDLPVRLVPKISPGMRIHFRELEQVHVCLSTPGLSITDSQRFSLSLLNSLLGGNMSSRLFQEIRERRGLAYSVYSFISSHVDTGMFGIYAGVHPNNVQQTIELIAQGMNAICRIPVTAAELQDAKEFTKGNIILATESVDNQMVRLAQNEIHFNDYIPLESVIERIEAVTTDDIQDLARTLFKAERCGVTLLGQVDDKTDFKSLVAF
jgi:predicted Zn-dependent peptidase